MLDLIELAINGLMGGPPDGAGPGMKKAAHIMAFAFYAVFAIAILAALYFAFT